MECFKLTVEPVRLNPDIILSVNGVDIHYRDPLTHLNCTLHSLYEIPYFVKYLADTYTNGKVICLVAEATIFGESYHVHESCILKFNRSTNSKWLFTVRMD